MLSSVAFCVCRCNSANHGGRDFLEGPADCQCELWIIMGCYEAHVIIIDKMFQLTALRCAAAVTVQEMSVHCAAQSI